MKSKLTAALAAVALAAASLAPSAALARDHGRGGYGYGGGYHGGGYYDNGRHWRHNNDDAVAAGVVGLVLGLALGAAASDNNNGRRGCYDRCGSYRGDYYGGPPPQYGYAPPPPYRGYQNENGCIQQAQQWDPYSGRYVWVNVRVPC